MSNNFKVEVHEDYLEFYASGEENYDFSLQCFNKISSECHKNNNLKALLVDNLKGQLSIDEVAHLCKELTLVLKDIKMAYVDLHIEDHDLNEYGEFLLKGGNLEVRVFQGVEAAREWLTSSNMAKQNGR